MGADHEAGFGLLETIVATAIIALACGVIVTVLGTTAKMQGAAALPRDRGMVAAHDAAVELRAAAAYDSAAVTAILAAPGASWTAAPHVTVVTTIDGEFVDIEARSATAATKVRYPVKREALPQGATIDIRGNASAP